MTTALENCVYCGGDAHGTSGIYSTNGKSYKCAWCAGKGKVPVDTQWDEGYMASRKVRMVTVKKFLWRKWLASRLFDLILIAGLIIAGGTLIIGAFTLFCAVMKIPVPNL